MRGTVLYGPGDIRFEDRETPKIVEATDVVIRNRRRAGKIIRSAGFEERLIGFGSLFGSGVGHGLPGKEAGMLLLDDLEAFGV